MQLELAQRHHRSDGKALVRLLDGVEAEARRAFDNLRAVCAAAGGTLAEVARLGLYLTDLEDFAAVNAIMAGYFEAPYPARSTIGVSALPRGARFEVDAVLVLPG